MTGCHLAVIMVGAAGFEPTTTSPPDLPDPVRSLRVRTNRPSVHTLHTPPSSAKCCHLGCQEVA